MCTVDSPSVCSLPPGSFGHGTLPGALISHGAPRGGPQVATGSRAWELHGEVASRRRSPGAPLSLLSGGHCPEPLESQGGAALQGQVSHLPKTKGGEEAIQHLPRRLLVSRHEEAPTASLRFLQPPTPAPGKPSSSWMAGTSKRLGFNRKTCPRSYPTQYLRKILRCLQEKTDSVKTCLTPKRLH